MASIAFASFFVFMIAQTSCAEFKEEGRVVEFTVKRNFFAALWDGIKTTAKSIYNSIVNIVSTVFAQPIARGVKDALTPNASASARLYRDIDQILFAKRNATHEHGEFPQQWVSEPKTPSESGGQ